MRTDRIVGFYPTSNRNNSLLIAVEAFRLRELQIDSPGALSQHCPTSLMEHLMSSCISRFWKAAEQYCVPRSECMIVPATALLPRVRTAILRALRTRSVVIEVSMAQPRMRRLPRSKMVAKNPLPWVVGKYVMSLTHALLSVPGAKSRPKRLG